MGVYIKDMEMPKSCAECDCWSMCWNGIPAYNMCKSVCPLVPVPPHGRLIDADALAEHKFVCVPHVVVNDKEAGVAYRLGWNTAIEAIMENAKTVIGG